MLTVLSHRTHIFHIADLENDFVKGFLLPAGADFFVVVVNAAVLTFLLGIVFCKGFIEQIVIRLLNGGIGVFDIDWNSNVDLDTPLWILASFRLNQIQYPV